MEIALPPSGTRGVEIPGVVRELMRIMGWTGGVMFRLGAKVQGRPLLRLTTTGARTGQRRRVVLGWFPDDDRADAWLIVASNAGMSRHPGWAHNIARYPDAVMADVGSGEVSVDVEMLVGEERDNVWARVVETAPGYGSYLERTDRDMPIFRLNSRS